MAFVAISDDEVTPAGILKSEDRLFRGSLVTTGDSDSTGDGYSYMGDGVCG